MDTLKRNYELALAALEELTEELVTVDEKQDKAIRTRIQLAPAPLNTVLEGYGILPRASLFLGAAYDGLPILLNLNDPTPGPILVAGDQDSGKRAFLQTLSHAISITHSRKDLQFGIITEEPEKWRNYEENKNCMGVFHARRDEAGGFITSLANWAHNNRQEKRFALLLIDNLEIILKMNDKVQQNLRWLLLRGPNRRVWTFATLDATHNPKITPWLSAFRTRLFGSIKNLDNARELLPARGADLHLLESGLEFVLNENRQWIKFWVPPIK